LKFLEYRLVRRSPIPLAIVMAILLLVASGLHACSPQPNSLNQEKWDEIDPIFREFYFYLGGEKILGRPISSAKIDGSIQYQFTVGALLLYDPKAPAARRFQLAPLGRLLPLDPDPANTILVDDHFLPLVERLGGEHFTGKPLTKARLNSETGDFEQFFENVGFVRRGQLEPELLPYGSWNCSNQCSLPPQALLPAWSLLVVH